MFHTHINNGNSLVANVSRLCLKKFYHIYFRSSSSFYTVFGKQNDGKKKLLIVSIYRLCLNSQHLRTVLQGSNKVCGASITYSSMAFINDAGG